jgi:hypothetical protein
MKRAFEFLVDALWSALFAALTYAITLSRREHKA